VTAQTPDEQVVVEAPSSLAEPEPSLGPPLGAQERLGAEEPLDADAPAEPIEAPSEPPEPAESPDQPRVLEAPPPVPAAADEQPTRIEAGVAAAATATESGVIGDIEEILTWSREHESRIGYFAALYWHVATTLTEALKRGEFTNTVAMEHLNEVFFHRYLTAVHDTWAGRPPSESWQVAFDAAVEDHLIVVQHLLLGANAHINFDLAIAVAEAIPQAELPAFEPDYMKMNELLSSLIAGMAADISRFWPLLRFISRYAAGADDAIIAFSLRAARDQAWTTAVELAGMDPDQRAVAIAAEDQRVSALARLVVNPGWVLRRLLGILQRTERGTIVEIIEDLLRTTRGLVRRVAGPDR